MPVVWRPAIYIVFSPFGNVMSISTVFTLSHSPVDGVESSFHVPSPIFTNISPSYLVPYLTASLYLPACCA